MYRICNGSQECGSKKQTRDATGVIISKLGSNGTGFQWQQEMYLVLQNAKCIYHDHINLNLRCDHGVNGSLVSYKLK